MLIKLLATSDGFGMFWVRLPVAATHHHLGGLQLQASRLAATVERVETRARPGLYNGHKGSLEYS